MSIIFLLFSILSRLSSCCNCCQCGGLIADFSLLESCEADPRIPLTSLPYPVDCQPLGVCTFWLYILHHIVPFLLIYSVENVPLPYWTPLTKTFCHLPKYFRVGWSVRLMEVDRTRVPPLFTQTAGAWPGPTHSPQPRLSSHQHTQKDKDKDNKDRKDDKDKKRQDQPLLRKITPRLSSLQLAQDTPKNNFKDAEHTKLLWSLHSEPARNAIL